MDTWLAPASFLQERWFHSARDRRCNHNNVVAWRVDGPVDVDRLLVTLHALAERHETLRTALVSTSGGVRQSVRPPFEISVWRADVAGSARPEQDLDKLIIENAEQPFLLTEAPPWRVGLVRLARERHVLVIVVSHAFSDGWSMGVLFRDFVRLYHGIRLPELELQFADYAAWEQDVSAPQLASWWRERLPLPRPSLPGHVSRRDESAFRMDGRPIPPIDARERGRLAALAKAHGGGLAAAVTAGVVTALSRYVDGELVVGFMTANRDRAELQPLVGPVFDYLPLRLPVSRSVGSAVPGVCAALRSARTHRLPLGAITRAVSCAGPLFDVVVEYLPHSAVVPARGFAQYPVPELTVRHTGDVSFEATAPLNYIVWETPDGGLGGVVYGNAHVIPVEVLTALGREFRAMIRS